MDAKALFIHIASITECPHSSAPGAVTAGCQRVAHQLFDRIWRQSVQAAYLGKAGVIAQRHLNNFADRRGIQCRFVGHAIPGLRAIPIY